MPAPTRPSNAPRILALETSGRTGSVALAQGPDLRAEESFAHGMRHAVALMPTVAALCQRVGWQAADIDEVYVSTGPGSFTGLRIAVAVARTLAQALGCRLVAVNTLDAIAANAPADATDVVVVLDAKRSQVFAARYARHSAAADPGAAPMPLAAGAAGLRRVAGPILTDPTTFVAATPRPVAVMGEGVAYHREALRAGVAADAELRELDAALWTPRAATICRLGWALAQRGSFTPLEELLPVYIRLAEAEELWRKRRGLPVP